MGFCHQERGFVINRREAVERARKARSVRLLLLAQRWGGVDDIEPLSCDTGISRMRGSEVVSRPESSVQQEGFRASLIKSTPNLFYRLPIGNL